MHTGAVLLALASIAFSCGDDSAPAQPDAGGDTGHIELDSGSDLGPPPAPSRCRVAADCPPPPSGAAACVVSVCDVVTARCMIVAEDADGDGVGSADCPVPAGPDSMSGEDCDDTNPRRFPGRPEMCDPSEDEDCDTTTPGDRDGDGDSFGSNACCNVDDVLGEEVCGPDCDDTDAMIHPGAEDGPTLGCDGVDNDCDGTIDVGCLCSADVACGGAPDGIHNGPPAVCVRGVQRCLAGVLGMCEGAIGARVETCAPDGIDEDCDGEVNEPDVCGCTDGMERACGLPDGAIVGGASTCVAGRQTCVGGAWDACSGTVPPSTESCDAAARDEDCDGTANEGCGCSGTEEHACGVDGLVTGGNSQCRAGTQRCEGGVFSMCTGATGPSPETCDALDNDCDGMLNEDPESSASCTATNATTRCDLGRCIITACAAGYDDCDDDARTGCEVDLRSSATSCGVCGRACGTGQPCVGGVCDPAVALAAGGFFGSTARSCVVRSTGRVVCWGSNADWMMPDQLTPTLVSGISDAVDLAVGGASSVCAQRAGGEVVCWGASPTPMTAAGRVDGLAGGRSFYCVRRLDGTSHCWGDNETGQLGSAYGTLEFSADPLALAAPDVSSFALGGYHGCAVRASGAMTCWGGYNEGELGDGRDMNLGSAPVAVLTLDSVVSAEAGEQHSCAVRGDGRVYCWGMGGMLGLGDTTRRNRPIEVVDAIGATFVTCGSNFTCVIRSDRRVACWGAYPGSAASALRPVLLAEPVDVVDLAGGPDHACARTASGRILCWGGNMFGQLGNGTRISSSTPVEVVLP